MIDVSTVADHDEEHTMNELLSSASPSIVGYEHTLAAPAIVLWNDDHHLKPDHDLGD